MESTVPVAPVIRISGKGKGMKQYVVRCPYCEQQHFHGVGGGLGNRMRHCLDLPWLSKRAREIFLRNQEIYGKETTYDIIDLRHA